MATAEFGIVLGDDNKWRVKTCSNNVNFCLTPQAASDGEEGDLIME